MTQGAIPHKKTPRRLQLEEIGFGAPAYRSRKRTGQSEEKKEAISCSSSKADNMEQQVLPFTQ